MSTSGPQGNGSGSNGEGSSEGCTLEDNDPKGLGCIEKYGLEQQDSWCGSCRLLVQLAREPPLQDKHQQLPPAQDSLKLLYDLSFNRCSTPIVSWYHHSQQALQYTQD